MFTRDRTVGGVFQCAFHYRRGADPLHPRSDGGRVPHLDQQGDRFVTMPLRHAQPIQVPSSRRGQRVDDVPDGDQCPHVREYDRPGRIVVETTIDECVENGLQLPLHVFHYSEHIGLY
ncbi:hypothetical protein [Gordonia sp. NB41Y]|uniref:hypothetical protein n=1 Tax=Gordonia sp. NB41Y TaxID=875808 RepID=UPI00273C373E|nr:hypothetical protein [Gordonia sp. NB41Y]WLP88967.1 hypothetical protein Q9K23_15285 [Gordonia sp. NB41Y]